MTSGQSICALQPSIRRSSLDILVLAAASNALPLTQVDDYAENVLAQRKNINRRAGTTYYLKHRAEPAIGYCTGGGIFGASSAGTVIFTQRAHQVGPVESELHSVVLGGHA